MKKKRTASLKQNLLVLIKNEECSFREQAKKITKEKIYTSWHFLYEN